MDRRNFVLGASAMSFAFAAPQITLAQDEKPDFTISGEIESDPPGYSIAWSEDWEQIEREAFSARTIPGLRKVVALDLVDAPDAYSTQRVIIESSAMEQDLTNEEILDSFADDYPETNLGYAPGTRIETRQLTDNGCWFSFAGGENPFETGVVGLSLWYTPRQADEPLVNVWFNFAGGENRTPEFLETIDSTISLNGNWLLGLDELDAYWEAFEASTGSTL